MAGYSLPTALWSDFNILTRKHFYHVGASEDNRNPMIEAIVTNYDISLYKYKESAKQTQLMLFDKRVAS